MRIKFFSYLDTLNVISIFLSREPYDEIYYFNISKIGKMSVRLFGLSEIVKPFNFNLSDINDHTGESYFPRIFGGDLIDVCDAITHDVLDKNPFINAFGNIFNLENFLLYVRKLANREISDIVVFLNVVTWHRIQVLRNKQTYINFSIEKTPFFNKLSAFAYNKHNINLSSHVSLRKVIGYFYRFSGNLYLSSVACVVPIIHALSFSSSSPKQVPEHRSSPLVASSYTMRGLTLDLTQRCDFSWLLMSDIPRDQVLIYFERKDMPPSDEKLNILKQQGINYVALSSIPGASEELSVYRSTMKVTTMLIAYTTRVFLLAIKEIVSLRLGSLAYLNWALYFVREFAKAFDFYSMNGIKINIDITDHDPYRIPRQLALEANGGISISYQASNWPIPNVLFGSGADIMFLFGPYYYPKLTKSGTRNHSVIFSGYLSDYSFALVRDKSKKLREGLVKNGAKFIICYFDENSSDDRMSIIPNKRSALIYKHLLELVLADETLGLICSPKRPKNLFKRLPDIVALMQTAKNTGRCIIMDGEYTAQNYPTEAAQAADVAVSLLVGGTTSLENFLSGVRVVYLDLEGLYSYPEYHKGKNTLVFDRLDDLTSAINKYRKNRGAFDDFGNINLSPGIKDKDPFRDGRAAVRMGQYINFLLDMFNQGRKRDDAIEYADRKYAELWGDKNVVKWH